MTYEFASKDTDLEIMIWWDKEHCIARLLSVGEMTPAATEKIYLASMQLMNEAESPVDWLVDLRACTGFPSSIARKTMVELDRDPRIRFQAFVINSNMIRAVVSLILNVSGQKRGHGVFPTEEEALAWLDEKKHTAMMSA